MVGSSQKIPPSMLETTKNQEKKLRYSGKKKLKYSKKKKLRCSRKKKPKRSEEKPGYSKKKPKCKDFADCKM